MNEEQKMEIRQIIEQVLHEKGVPLTHQSQIVPKVIKQRHIQDYVIKSGTSTDRPTDGAKVGVYAYFNTDTNVLSIWNTSSEVWVDYAAIPSSLADYTASNVTEDRTYNADSTTTAELADVLGTLIADLQSIGLID